MSRIDIRTIRRKQIIEAAKELTTEKGWGEVTIADICKRADISVGGLTHHFKGKEEIMFAVLEDLAELIKAETPDIENISSLQEMMELAFAVFSDTDEERLKTHRLLFHFVSSALYRPDIAQRLREAFGERSNVHAVELSKKMQMEGEGPQKLCFMMELLHCFGLGLILSKIMRGPDYPAQQLAQEMAKMFDMYLERSNEADK